MKKVSLIAGVTSIVAVAGMLWSMPAAADMCGMAPCARAAHDKIPTQNREVARTDQEDATTGVPEPGILALLALGFGGVGLSALRRRRN